MNPATKIEPQAPRRTFFLLLLSALILSLGFAAWRLFPRSAPLAAEDSVAGLEARMIGEEEDAIIAQVELEKRLGTDNVEVWQRFLDSPSSRARALAVESVGKGRTPAVAALMTHMLEDPASSARINAVQSLGLQEPRLAIKPLLAALKDDDTWISQAAADRLGKLKLPEAVPDLMAALHNPDRFTASFAANSLKRLTGQKLHGSSKDSDEKFNRLISDWESWWKRAQAGWRRSPELENVPQINPSRSFAAPEFALDGLSGSRMTLAGLRGKVVLINFWATDCGPCLVELPGLESVYRKYSGKGLVVLGVEMNQHDSEALKRFAGARQISYPLFHATKELEAAYGHIHDVPVSFLIDREGRIRYEWDGDREERVFDAAIQKLLTK